VNRGCAAAHPVCLKQHEGPPLWPFVSFVVQVLFGGPLTTNKASKSAAAARKLRRRINFYPPYLGASVRVTHIADDFRRVEVEMPLRFYNRNYFGTHFGGSLYSMCDPFYVLMLANIFGPDYIVWDKAANIRFKKPGKGVMKAIFELTEEKIAEIRTAAETQPKVEPMFLVLVKDEEGNVVAEIDKLLYIKKKK
jgi:acyl-coenzyme A thioesterase PaaI-like protein